MKIYNFVFWFIIFSFISNLTNAQDRLFKKFANNNKVTSISVSKLFLNFVPDFLSEGANMTKFINKVESAQMLYTGDEKLAKRMRKQADKFARNDDYIPMLEAKDTFLPVIYIKKDNALIDQIILYYSNKKKFVLLKIDGNDLTAEDINSIVENKQ